MKNFKRIISVILALMMLVSAAVVVNAADDDWPYKDVGKKKWFYTAIKYSVDNGLMNGTSKTKFSPNDPMTRAMFVTVLGRLCGAEEIMENTFSDVKMNQYYAGYVGWAVKIGVVSGYPDGTFKPDANVNRQEAAAMLSRYIEHEGLLLDFVDELPGKYSDDAKFQKWTREFIEELSFYGIFEGDENGKFAPKDNLTRAQGATLFMRLHEMFGNAKSASEIVSAYDLINTPESFISNFDSVLDESGEYPVLKLTPHSYFNAPWYIGMDVLKTDITTGALEYVKIAYKGDSTADPYMTVKSPVFESEQVKPIATGEENGYKTAVFSLGDLIREHRENYFNAELPYKDTDKLVLNELNIRSLYNTHLNVLFYPYDKNVTSAELLYVSYFATESEAKAFTAASAADYIKGGTDEYPKADIRENGEAAQKEYTDKLYERAEEIRESESAVKPSDIKGTVYYISTENGNDKNDGLTPETAYASVLPLYEIKAGGLVINDRLQSGDGVFVERGSVLYPQKKLYTRWSGDKIITLPAGVTLGAYGEGEKPIFTTAVDIEGKTKWLATEYENVWKLDFDFYCDKADAAAYYDVGSIAVYDKSGNLGFGVKVIPTKPKDPYQEGSMTEGLGLVSNGFETFVNEEIPVKDPSVVKHNLEYFMDYAAGALYMYCDKGNPGEYYDKIIAARRGSALTVSGVDITVDNIAIAHCGSHGIDIGDAKNFIVTNCTIEWVGGCLQGGGGDDKVRYGNGFQNWQNCDGIYIENTFFDQIYDGACSTQVAWPDDKISVVNDFHVTDCVFIDSNSQIEIWNLAENEVTANTTITGCYFLNEPMEDRFGAQRVAADGTDMEYAGACMFYFSPLDPITYDNCLIENNVYISYDSKVYEGRQFLYRGNDNGIITKNNIFFGGKEGTSDVLASLPSVDLRCYFVGVNEWDIRHNRSYYNNEFISEWTGLGCDRGSIFYVVK